MKPAALASRNIPPKIVNHLYDIGGADFGCISNCSMQFLYITHDLTNHYIQHSVQCLLCFFYNNTPILQSVKMKVISKLENCVYRKTLRGCEGQSQAVRI